MKSRTQILILCLLCVVRISKVLSKDITQLEEKIAVQDDDLRKNLTRESNESDEQDTGKLRDKRALGLLLSGLAQIFGYTVTPIQLATLPNPNTTMKTMLSKLTGPQTASSRPASTNTTAPKRQETIRFTGVVNFGNNSDILGHLQRYEQIFHGNSTRPVTTMTTSRPAPSPKPAPNFLADPRTSLPTRPPLLTPFFVKIPLPIAPELLPTNVPVEEDLKLSYPLPLITIASESSEETPPEAPVRKAQETVYKNNEDTEHYTVEEKEIYDEKDVRKPVSKYTHQLYVDEPTLSKQQDERYNEVQRKQEEHVAEVKVQEAQRNRDQEDHDREDEINERYGHREKEIANRNRDHVSKYSSSEERRPAYDDEESAERYEEQAEPNRSNESSERPAEDERENTERYPDYGDDESGKQSEYKQSNDLSAPLIDFDKLIVAYNQQLPIGDYFHQSKPENIRDSYGEILSNKKPEDDRSDYLSMFKPYVNGYDYQRIRDPENASQEGKTEEESSTTNGYDEHLKRIEKLREEYALPVTESKYEEYDINDEGDANRNGRQDEKDENHNAVKSKKPKTSRVRGKEDVRTKTGSGSSKNQLQRGSEEAKSQEEFDLTKYTPLIVPIRYVDASDRVEQASMQRLKFKEAKKKLDNSEISSADKVNLAIKIKPTPQIASLPERTRQLHEGEQKDFQLWPPPFDYAFDNTERTNTIVPPNPHNYLLNYYQQETSTADNKANSEDNSSEQPAGYLVVVGDPVHQYQHPYNIYYFPNEVITQNQNSHLNAENTHPQHQFYVSQENADQRPTQVTLNSPEYSRNETTKSSPKYYYQPQEAAANVLNRYAFGEYGSQLDALPNIDSRGQISSTENWSNRIYPSQPRRVTGQSSPSFTQNVAPSNRNEQGIISEKRYPRPPGKKKSSRLEDQRQNDRKAKVPPPRHSAPRRKPFDDPQSAHDFFGFSKNDYSFDGESGNASKAAEENGKNTESHVFDAPEPAAYHHDESTVKHIDEPENNTEKAVVREYRNKAATLRVSEQRRSRPNGPIYYVDFTRNI